MYILEQSTGTSGGSNIYIGENPSIPGTPTLPINIRLLLGCDLAIAKYPEHFGLTPEQLDSFKKSIDDALAKSRPRRLTDNTD